MIRPAPHIRYHIAAILAVHKYFPMIRYAGLFANRWKKKDLSQGRIALNQAETDDTDTHTHQSWAERQSEYTGTDPLRCPNCDQSLTDKNIHGEIVIIDRKSLDPNTEVMRF